MFLLPLAILAAEFLVYPKAPAGAVFTATLDGRTVAVRATDSVKPRVIVLADIYGSSPDASEQMIAALRTLWPELSAAEPVEYRAITAPPLEIVAAGDVPSVFVRAGARFGPSRAEPRSLRQVNALASIAGRAPLERGPVRLIWISSNFDWCTTLRDPALDALFSGGDAKPKTPAPPMPSLAGSGLVIFPIWIRETATPAEQKLAATFADYSGGTLIETPAARLADAIRAAVADTREATVLSIDDPDAASAEGSTPRLLTIDLPGGGELRRLILTRRQLFFLPTVPVSVDWAPKLYTHSAELNVSADCGAGRLKLSQIGDTAPAAARLHLRQTPPPNEQRLIRRASYDVSFAANAACIDLPVIRPGDRWRIVAVSEQSNWLGYSAFTVLERSERK